MRRRIAIGALVAAAAAAAAPVASAKPRVELQIKRVISGAPTLHIHYRTTGFATPPRLELQARPHKKFFHEITLSANRRRAKVPAQVAPRTTYRIRAVSRTNRLLGYSNPAVVYSVHPQPLGSVWPSTDFETSLTRDATPFIYIQSAVEQADTPATDIFDVSKANSRCASVRLSFVPEMPSDQLGTTFLGGTPSVFGNQHAVLTVRQAGRKPRTVSTLNRTIGHLRASVTLGRPWHIELSHTDGTEPMTVRLNGSLACTTAKPVV